MDAIGILSKFKGVLCHNHWKAYYRYGCLHSLCNAHHLRELEWSHVEDKQKWAGKFKSFLVGLNKKVDATGGALNKTQSAYDRKRYNLER